MKFAIRFTLRTLGIGLLIFAAGCAGHREHQFDPIPTGQVSALDLDPATIPKGDYPPLVYPDPLPERVLYEINDIKTRYPKNFQIGLDRAQSYMPYIESAFAREGLPSELIWVAMVESQFNTKAVSRAGASGMWQFMGPAARRFDLRMDTYVDERFTWQKQTYAAIGYLKALYTFFDGDWALAVTAYNMGEGGLSRLIQAHGGERDFWKLVEITSQNNAMREETQKYYPRLLASALVAKNPEKYGFKRNPATPDESVGVLVDGMYALDDLDQAMGYPRGTLARLNPGLVQGVTPPSGSYDVYVPRSDREQFMLALNSTPKVRHTPKQVHAQAHGHGTHKVARGETISQLARKYGVSTNEMMSANNIKSPQNLRVGQMLRIPGHTTTPSTAPTAAPATRMASAPQPQTTATSYTVKKGDTLSSIATRHGVTVASLQQSNNKGNSTRLTVGERLKINVPASGTPASSAASVIASSAPTPNATYTVQKGDTLSTIATRQGVPVATLQQWNGLGNSTNIRVGQSLKVHSPTSAPAPATTLLADASGTYHTVKAGEYPASIARAHRISLTQLLELNNLDKNTVLQIGDKLLVSGTPAAAADAPQLQLAAAPVTANAALASNGSTPKVTHTVAKGDTPGGIAQKYGVSTRDLLAWNNLSPKSVIKIDQKLVVYPATSARAAASEAESEPAPKTQQTVTHVVTQGQSPWQIARHYGVAVDDLHRWNQWKQNHVLKVGDKVTVHVPK